MITGVSKPPDNGTTHQPERASIRFRMTTGYVHGRKPDASAFRLMGTMHSMFRNFSELPGRVAGLLQAGTDIGNTEVRANDDLRHLRVDHKSDAAKSRHPRCVATSGRFRV